MAELELSLRVVLIGFACVAAACQHAPAAGSRPSTTGASNAQAVVSARPPVSTPTVAASVEPAAPNPIQSQADCPKDMIFIPEGDLSYTAPVPGKKDKTPRAQHFHLRAFCIDRTEPKNDDWKQVLATCGQREEYCRNKSYGTQPLDCVTHEQAKCFCEHSSSAVHKRLPSDSEWLYAALGSDGRKFPWGNEVVPTGADERNFCVEQDNVDSPIWLCSPARNTMDRSPFGVLGMATNGAELNGTCLVSEDMPGEACMGRTAYAVRNPYLSLEPAARLDAWYFLHPLGTRPVLRASPTTSFRCATSEHFAP